MWLLSAPSLLLGRGLAHRAGRLPSSAAAEYPAAATTRRSEPIFDRDRPPGGVPAWRDRDLILAGPGLEHPGLAVAFVEVERLVGRARARAAHLCARPVADQDEVTRPVVGHR